MIANGSYAAYLNYPRVFFRISLNAEKSTLDKIVKFNPKGHQNIKMSSFSVVSVKPRKHFLSNLILSTSRV